MNLAPPTASAAVRVLLVDDEPNLRHLLSAVLRRQGWEVETASNGKEAIEAALRTQPHLIVLDVVMPDIDGLQVLRAIRPSLPDTMVLFLTANGTVANRITGIAAGADDYVTKPFSVEEVVVRLHGLLRRSPLMTLEVPSPLITVGDLELHEESHRVTRAGNEIHLTATEFALLRYLMLNADRVLSKEQILDRVWDYDFGRDSNIVEIYIGYLRKKIDAHHEAMIHTIRRVGYILRAPQTGNA